MTFAHRLLRHLPPFMRPAVIDPHDHWLHCSAQVQDPDPGQNEIVKIHLAVVEKSDTPTPIQVTLDNITNEDNIIWIRHIPGYPDSIKVRQSDSQWYENCETGATRASDFSIADYKRALARVHWADDVLEITQLDALSRVDPWSDAEILFDVEAGTVSMEIRFWLLGDQHGIYFYATPEDIVEEDYWLCADFAPGPLFATYVFSFGPGRWYVSRGNLTFSAVRVSGYSVTEHGMKVGRAHWNAETEEIEVTTLVDSVLAHVWLSLCPESGVTQIICESAGAQLSELADSAKLLPARAATKRLVDQHAGYYASADRRADLIRLGRGMLLDKRSNETWDAFETRLQEFLGLEDWAGDKTKYTVLGDVSQWGCFTGIIREIERTGLLVSDIYSARDRGAAWRVYQLAPHDPVIPPEQYHKIYSIETGVPPGQATTRVFRLKSPDYLFYIELEQPETPVEYSAEEVKEIVKLTKPAWTTAMVLFPDSEVWVKVV